MKLKTHENYNLYGTLISQFQFVLNTNLSFMNEQVNWKSSKFKPTTMYTVYAIKNVDNTVRIIHITLHVAY